MLESIERIPGMREGIEVCRVWEARQAEAGWGKIWGGLLH